MNMKGYKVAYKGRSYEVVEANLIFAYESYGWMTGIQKPTDISVWVINDDGLLVLIRDEARKFQFVKDLGE